ncbi:hypothetical protein MUG10_11040 [Xanthomonas prunicola]|uniref:hypothetical protein n=1 Tax=Xanthomonas prunicola TaxID=2053930 RepID=UPI0020788600|nr:hypothetical protein [Xanthomonas prunicola]USJ02987.1 hypothetical protein MUG10_11040 [Xanthomonas prunicola]UXA55430.1 hypothetical protein M0D45_10280 [Xanthomonas prunicola]
MKAPSVRAVVRALPLVAAGGTDTNVGGGAQRVACQPIFGNAERKQPSIDGVCCRIVASQEDIAWARPAALMAELCVAAAALAALPMMQATSTDFDPKLFITFPYEGGINDLPRTSSAAMRHKEDVSMKAKSTGQ